MADLTITAASVVADAGSPVSKDYAAGVAAMAGQVVYLDSTVTPPVWKLGDADLAAARSPGGIVLNGAAVGQPLAVATPGAVVTIGATLIPGTFYYLSKTAGGIAPVADITGTGTYPTIVGVAVTAAKLKVAIVESGVAL